MTSGCRWRGDWPVVCIGRLPRLVRREPGVGPGPHRCRTAAAWRPPIWARWWRGWASMPIYAVGGGGPEPAHRAAPPRAGARRPDPLPAAGRTGPRSGLAPTAGGYRSAPRRAAGAAPARAGLRAAPLSTAGHPGRGPAPGLRAGEGPTTFTRGWSRSALLSVYTGPRMKPEPRARAQETARLLEQHLARNPPAHARGRSPAIAHARRRGASARCATGASGRGRPASNGPFGGKVARGHPPAAATRARPARLIEDDSGYHFAWYLGGAGAAATSPSRQAREELRREVLPDLAAAAVQAAGRPAWGPATRSRSTRIGCSPRRQQPTRRADTVTPAFSRLQPALRKRDRFAGRRDQLGEGLVRVQLLGPAQQDLFGLDVLRDRAGSTRPGRPPGRPRGRGSRRTRCTGSGR